MAAFAICLTMMVGALAVGMWQAGQQSERVEAAVRATLPRFCKMPGQQLSVHPVSKPIFPGWPLSYATSNWTVSCRTPGVYGLTQIRVFGATCEMTFISDYRRIRKRDLVVCP
jgi:hypothetical protein